jgi:hypothetical protein
MEDKIENEAEFKYLGTIGLNFIHEEIKSRLNVGNDCCHSVQELFCLPASHIKGRI